MRVHGQNFVSVGRIPEIHFRHYFFAVHVDARDFTAIGRRENEDIARRLQRAMGRIAEDFEDIAAHLNEHIGFKKFFAGDGGREAAALGFTHCGFKHGGISHVGLAESGLLTYVHPPSAPAWGMALWCGFLFYLPKAWSFPRKLFFMLGAGCAFLIAAGPFIATYFENHSHSPSGDYGQIISIMKASYSRGLLDIPHAILDFANTISFKSGPGTRMIVPSLLLPGAICGFFAIAKIQKIKAEQYQLLWGWLLGLLFVSAVVPLAEHEICRRLSMAPIEISFIRGLRYLVPLCMLFCIWPLAEMHRNCRSDIARKRILWIGILAAVLWAALHPPPGVARNIWRTAMTGQFEPLVRQQAELKQAMDFIRDEVAPGTRIFVAPPGRYALAARYYALKPVVFCSKDRNAFAFANHDKLIQWDHRWKEYNAVFHRPARGRLGGLIELAAQLDAEVLFIDKRTTRIGSADAKAQLLFENDEFFIITLNGLSVKEPEPLHSEKKRAAQTGVPGVGDSDK